MSGTNLGRCLLLFLLATATCGMQSPPPSSQQAQIEDIDFITRQYIEREQAFNAETRAQALQIAARLRQSAGTLTREQLSLGIGEIVAAADNAHSIFGYRSRDALPLRMASFGQAGWLILRAAPPYGDLAGGIVTHVDGRPVTEIMNRVTSYYGGLRVRREILGMELLSSGGMLHTIGLASDPAGLRLTIRDREGQSADHEVAFVPRSSVGSAFWPHRWWSPEPITGDTTPWVMAIPAAQAPLYLRNAEQNFQIIKLPELDAVYLQMWSNEESRGVRDFVRRAEQLLRTRPARNLIVDLRFNKGGDVSLTGSMMRSLPQSIPDAGRIYVIIGRYTMSAGIVDAAIIKRAGGDRVTLVGEPAGDGLRFWSEGDTVCTPNSHICARYTDGYFDAVDGCEGERGCFRENSRWDFVVGNLDIDLPAPMSAAAYLDRRDPAMDVIAADLRRTSGAVR